MERPSIRKRAICSFVLHIRLAPHAWVRTMVRIRSWRLPIRICLAEEVVVALEGTCLLVEVMRQAVAGILRRAAVLPLPLKKERR